MIAFLIRDASLRLNCESLLETDHRLSLSESSPNNLSVLHLESSSASPRVLRQDSRYDVKEWKTILRVHSDCVILGFIACVGYVNLI